MRYIDFFMEHYGWQGAALAVVIGTTLGMLVADVPAVFIGDRFSKKVSLRAMRMIAAAVFLVFAAAPWISDLF